MDERNDPNLLFWFYLADNKKNLRKKLLSPETGPYLFFRRNKTGVQALLAEYMAHDQVPQVFLHGSPHIDNYAKTEQGYGMIDFDRAYIGPYLWDLACVLLAIALRNPETYRQPLSAKIKETFIGTYEDALQHPDRPYLPYQPLELITPKRWEIDPDLYLEDKHKWAKQLHEAKLPEKDPIADALFQGYRLHLEDKALLTGYHVKQRARAAGSFGRKRYLFLLTHADKTPCLLDMKETKNYLNWDWPHLAYYHSPFQHEGERMRHAAKIYAPGLAKGESYATVNGIQYWGRTIPFLNRKPAKCFSLDDQISFAYSAASQLARGHALAVHQTDPDRLLAHLHTQWATLNKQIEAIKTALFAVWEQCCVPSVKVKK